MCSVFCCLSVYGFLSPIPVELIDLMSKRERLHFCLTSSLGGNENLDELMVV